MKSLFTKSSQFLTLALLGTFLLGTIQPLTVHGAVASYQKSLLRLHNEERAKRNRQPLRLHGALNRAAVRYAVVMSREPGTYLDHTGPDGSTFDQRILAAGGTNFSTMAENIALGQPNESAVNLAWMRSAGHRSNILNPRFKFVGFGRAGGAPHWVTNFGG